MASLQDIPPAGRRLSRRTYLIDRGFQLKYALLLVAASVLICGLFGGMMYLVHAEAQQGIALPPALEEQLARANTTLLVLMGAITLMMAVAFGLLGLLLTHRVAGPA